MAFFSEMTEKHRIFKKWVKITVYPGTYASISKCIWVVLNLKQRRRGVNEVQIVIRGISWRGVHITSSGTYH